MNIRNVFLIALVVASPAFAQTGADFFKGQTVTYIVATAPGGGYDLYTRLVARHFGARPMVLALDESHRPEDRDLDGLRLCG